MSEARSFDANFPTPTNTTQKPHKATKAKWGLSYFRGIYEESIYRVNELPACVGVFCKRSTY